MELRYYLSILWRRKWTIIMLIAMVTAITVYGTNLMVPQYAATSTLWVPATTDEQVGGGEILLNDRLMNTYSKLTTSRPVMAELRQRLPNVPEGVRSSIRVEPVAQTELLNVTVYNSDPELAAAISTSVSQIVIEQTQKTAAGRTLRVSLFEPASVPTDPNWLGLITTPYWREVNIGLAIVISLIGGVALAFFLEYLDTTLHTAKEVEDATELATLGQIPRARRQDHIAQLNGNSLHGEAFRYLRTNILFDQEATPQTLLITSAMPREGKSTITANLAYAIAQTGRRVIVVDTDLRLPTQNKIFDLPTEVGLSNLLTQEVTLAEALQKSSIPRVQVITSGPVPANPASLLDSPQMIALIEQLKQQAGFILFDAPASLAVTDAAVLAPLVDGVLLVVDQQRAYQSNVQAARSQLASVGARVLGLVLNRSEQDPVYYYRYMSAVSRAVKRGAR